MVQMQAISKPLVFNLKRRWGHRIQYLKLLLVTSHLNVEIMNKTLTLLSNLNNIEQLILMSTAGLNKVLNKIESHLSCNNEEMY